jgi:hypothetical protein
LQGLINPERKFVILPKATIFITTKNNQYMEQEEKSLFDVSMDSTTQHHLHAISKWAKFIAITGFFFGAVVILLLATASTLVIDQFSALLSVGGDQLTFLIVVVVIAMLIVFIWLYFLLRASHLLKKGLDHRNSHDIAEGFKAMRIYFIISFVFSILSIISTLQTFA